MQAVREAVVRSPYKSICRLSVESSMHRASARRILMTELHLFPYKIHSQSKLTYQQRAKSFARNLGKEFCKNLQGGFQEN